MVGMRISHYHILEKLGTGGMGEVYLARDIELDRFVAIKILPADIVINEAIKERFKREAKATAAMNHPNIVTIFEFGEFNNTNYIAMEYVEGISLKELIAKGEISSEQVLDIFKQICDGLKEAHNAGIVHRDLKPDNILIDKNNKTKIVDFGLAKLKGAKQVTKESTTLGTPNYMAPEQYQNGLIDIRTDIWALGVILFELITRESPFKGNNEAEIMYSVLSKEPELNSDLWSEYPESIKSIVLKAVNKNPKERYQSLTELLNDFHLAIQQPDLKFISAEKVSYLKFLQWIKKPITILTIILFMLISYFVFKNQNWIEWLISDNIIGTNWENSVAVLPFKNMSSDTEQEFFCDGMTEQIISNLAKLQRLKVIARTSVMKYKQTNKSISEIGKELNVAHVLEGSIRKQGNHIRITAQLINTKDGFHMWSEDYDKLIADIFEIQDGVSEAIAKSLLQKISGQEISAIKTKRPKNIEAYEYLLKGNYFHDKIYAHFREDDWLTAKKYFETAIEFDKEYADSYALLANLYYTHSILFSTTDEKKNKDLLLEETYVDKALRLDSISATVLLAKGWMHRSKAEYYHRTGDLKKIEFELDKAFMSYKKAYIINNNDLNVIDGIADFYFTRGLVSLSVNYYNKVLELNPLDHSAYTDRAKAYLRIGDFNKVESDFKEALEIEPDHLNALINLSRLYIAEKKYEEAKKLIIQVEKIYPNFSTNWEHALLFALNQEKEKALNTWKDKSLILYSILGMKDEAINVGTVWSEEQIKFKMSQYYFLQNHPFYENIREDSRFQEILEKHKKLHEENLRKYGNIE